MEDVAEVAEQFGGGVDAVAQSRHLLRRFLAGTALEEHGEVGALLISELVTNVVLHAGGHPSVRLLIDGPTLRVEVDDASRTVPRPRDHQIDAATGRGLALVEALAVAWGAEPTESGKTIWFELGRPSHRSAAPTGSSAPSRTLVPVRFLDLPVVLVRATIEHGEALLRELAWLAFDDAGGLSDDARNPAPELDLGGLLDVITTARYEGRARIDVTVDLPAGAGEAAIRRLALIDEAERAAADGDLLIPAGVPEISECRHWILGEIARQSTGVEPQRWLPLPPEDTGSRTGLPSADIATHGGPDIVIADTSNRIRFVGSEVAILLGWTAADLVGHRLTALIPPELREAHLAGFTRHQTLGEQVILGKDLTLPARRRDGSIREVAVSIEVVKGADRSKLYRASLRPLR